VPEYDVERAGTFERLRLFDGSRVARVRPPLFSPILPRCWKLQWFARLGRSVCAQELNANCQRESGKIYSYGKSFPNSDESFHLRPTSRELQLQI
jgi:hypothetical protein